MERLLGAASPFSLESLLWATSSLSTLSSPSSPPQAMNPLVLCQDRADSNVSLGMAIYNTTSQNSISERGGDDSPFCSDTPAFSHSLVLKLTSTFQFGGTPPSNRFIFITVASLFTVASATEILLNQQIRTKISYTHCTANHKRCGVMNQSFQSHLLVFL